MPELIVGVLALVAFTAIEAYYLHTNQATISEHIRTFFLRYPPAGLLVGLVVGLFLGHFFWFN
ncbi:MAG TPA: hypothetical protein VLA89_01610 [Gemmatimonadales bacterium]|nr:hypothetical protein [Gemmatimonadales bacterium]